MMDVTNHQALHERAQSRLGIGGNQPPSPIDYAKEAATELADYLRENPVIATFDQAKEIGGWIERTRISLSTARDARDTELAPHLEKAGAIRTTYDAVREKTPKNPGGALTRLYETAKARLTTYKRRGSQACGRSGAACKDRRRSGSRCTGCGSGRAGGHRQCGSWRIDRCGASHHSSRRRFPRILSRQPRRATGGAGVHGADSERDGRQSPRDAPRRNLYGRQLDRGHRDYGVFG